MIKFIQKTSLKIIYPIMRVFWKLFKPKTLGVRVAVFNDDNEVLLVKHTYRKGYHFPGGGVHGLELFKDATVRELKEETGLSVSKDDLKMIGAYQYFEEGKNDVVVFSTIKYIGDKTDIVADGIEIEDARWFKINELPDDSAFGVKEHLDSLLKNDFEVIGLW